MSSRDQSRRQTVSLTLIEAGELEPIAVIEAEDVPRKGEVVVIGDARTRVVLVEWRLSEGWLLQPWVVLRRIEEEGR